MKHDLTRIIALAEALAEDHRETYGGGDPHKGFRDYQVVVAEQDFGDAFEGLLRYRDDEYQVFINCGSEVMPRTIGRKRYTAAHEFGHYSIRAHREAIRMGHGLHKDGTGFASSAPMEREADVFAAHFLVPTAKLKKRYRQDNWGAKEILDAAQFFGSSITCAALRCQASLAGNSTLIYWGPTHVRWQRMNSDWWFELPAKSVRNADQLIKGSATEEILNGAPMPACGYISRGTTRSAWFKRVSSWSNSNSILVEEVISLGSYGHLTLLRPDCSGL